MSSARVIERHKGDVGVRTLGCADLLRILAFSQLAWRESLRDIEVCLEAIQAKLFHMRFASAPARSTLADALNLRDWRIYHALAPRPISHARALYAEDASVLDLNASVYALDSTVLINRINLFWGANWSAIPNHFPPRSLERGHDRCPDLVIGCVDTRSARKAIEDSFSRTLSQTYYWLDLGNNAASGQYVLGQPLNARNRRKANRLKTIGELCPEIVDADVGEDPLPSCSAVEALDRQEPFINQTLASSALTMMAQLFRYGKLSHHGAFFNAKTGRMCALPVDPALWSKTRKRTRRIQQAIGSK